MTKPAVEVVPSAKRLIGSLRDLGYTTVEAIADLVDNSIVAGARRVDIVIHFDGAYSWISIADDGHGMNGTEVTEAMRYGSERDYEAEDLGKFGLGLKTASMSQCRSLSVASRVSKETARIEARLLDLDHIEETDSWEVLIIGVEERPDELVEPLRQHRGTVVLWDDLDRILNYRNPGSEWARNRLLLIGEQLDQHLGMVFHRFLAGEVPRRAKLTITVNGTPVEPWDPFARDESETEPMGAHDFEIHTATGAGIVRLEPFVLPPKKQFSSDAAHQLASGPNDWNRQQGFYIYRANRMIQSGGWSRMRTQDEHHKLARIGMLFSPDLDAAMGINVAKMRVILPPELKEAIKPTVDRVIRRADAVYRQKPDDGGTSRGGSRAARAAPNENGPPAPEGEASPDQAPFTATDRRRALEEAASQAHERDALDSIVEALHSRNPRVARDLGW